MPQAEERTYVIEVMPSAAEYRDAGDSELRPREAFTSHDIDMLVSHIKENLRLSGLKSRSSRRVKVRSAPYRIPARNGSEACELCMTSRATLVGSAESEQQQQALKAHQPHCRHYRSGVERRLALEDSYERFQNLLRRGALIKEAVKRLQTSSPVNCEPDELDDESEDGAPGKRRATSTSATSTTLDSMDEEEDEDDFLYRRKRFYYDSEDEPLPSVYEPLDL